MAAWWGLGVWIEDCRVYSLDSCRGALSYRSTTQANISDWSCRDGRERSQIDPVQSQLLKTTHWDGLLGADWLRIQSARLTTSYLDSLQVRIPPQGTFSSDSNLPTKRSMCRVGRTPRFLHAVVLIGLNRCTDEWHAQQWPFRNRRWIFTARTPTNAVSCLRHFPFDETQNVFVHRNCFRCESGDLENYCRTDGLMFK